MKNRIRRVAHRKRAFCRHEVSLLLLAVDKLTHWWFAYYNEVLYCYLRQAWLLGCKKCCLNANVKRVTCNAPLIDRPSDRPWSQHYCIRNRGFCLMTCILHFSWSTLRRNAHLMAFWPALNQSVIVVCILWSDVRIK